MFCPVCGKSYTEESVYCSKCGTYLLAKKDTEETTITFSPVEAEVEEEEEIKIPEKEIPSSGVMLVVKRGPSAGTRFILDKDKVSIGRHPESDLFLDDITVSRKHAEIRRDEKKYIIADLGSLNGTYVNKMRIDEAVLSSGDEVQIGKFKLIFISR